MAEATTTVAEIVAKQPERITVVTNDNFDAYVNDKLGIDPIKQAEQEAVKVEEEKAQRLAEDDPASEFLEKDKDDKKSKLNDRFKELTDKRKAAEKLAAENEAGRKAAEERAAAKEREAEELRLKYEPPKSNELGPKPERAQFNTDQDHEKALEDWLVDKVRIEQRARDAEQANLKHAETVKTEWNKNLASAKEEFPDYAEVITSSEVMVSNEAREAIVEDENGPWILRHLALNPEVAKKMGEMTVQNMLKEVGRLSAKVRDKPQTTATPAAELTKELTPSPKPITPLKGGNGAAITLRGTDEFHGSYEEYKKKRLAGKIH